MLDKILCVAVLVIILYIAAKILNEVKWGDILERDIIKEYIDKLYTEFELHTMDEICNAIFEIKSELRNVYNELKDEDDCLVVDVIIKVLDDIDFSKTKIYELREKITCIKVLFNLINWEDVKWNF